MTKVEWQFSSAFGIPQIGEDSETGEDQVRKSMKETRDDWEEKIDEAELIPSLITQTYDIKCTVENLDAELA